ncbi:MATE family efflux transporter [Feifania hominis]|uniref:Probable multidrug resistance protein NorM n=1 Tax=Feifania hominis TaxID=2763660 RepID=A0A926DCI9_9FIRM|nr:MATE family efflux transporter [Feifania hominis]MBC8535314.1 MATE family efflux transporter [Feifania hominis]
MRHREPPAFLTGQPLFSQLDLKRLIFPLVVEQVLAITVGMIDTVMISNVGEAAVSGVSLVDMVSNVIISIFAALATGGAVVAAQFIGSRNYDEARESANQLVMVMGLISVVITALALAFKRPLMELLFGHIEPDVMASSVTYLTITGLSYPFLAVYNGCAALFRSNGNSRISMKISIIMNLINLVGNSILIFGFRMGVTGAALATLAARVTAAVVIFCLLRHPDNVIRISFSRRTRFRPHLVRRILGIGIPNGLENSFFQFGRVLVLGIISSFGTVQIAANAVANNLSGLGCIPGQAMNLAMITVVGQCVGARDYPQADWFAKKLMRITYLVTAALNFVILCALPLLLNIYNLAGTLSADTLDLAYRLVFIHNGMAILIWPLAFTLPNALRAANDVRFTMGISIFSMLAFRLVSSYVMGIQLQMGAIGVWVAMILDWLFRSVCFAARFLSGKWKVTAERVQHQSVS